MSKLKGVFAQFSPNFDIFFLLILMLYDSKYAGNDSWIKIPSRFVWFHCDYASFFFPYEKWIFVFFINSFQKCSKNWKDYKSQKYLWIYQASCWTAYIESYSLRKIYQNLDKKWAKTTFILTVFIWGCWGCLRSKKFQMVVQA